MMEIDLLRLIRGLVMKHLWGKCLVLILLVLLAALVSGCKISGRITEGGTGIAGHTIQLSGDAQAVAITDAGGQYEFSAGEGCYTVTPVPDGSGEFLPASKQVFVRGVQGVQGVQADFTRLADDDASWDPSMVVPIQAHPEIRGQKVLRGLIHLHSIYSHDACDDKPWIEGQPNLPCYNQLREAICTTNQQFVMLSDHPYNFAWHEFPDVLLYQPALGDELIYQDDRPVANIITCPCGNRATITAGCESNLMPIGLKRMPDGRPEERSRLLSSATDEAVDQLHALGAMVFVTHPEGWDISALLSLPIEGLDVYNLHSNIAPNIRKDFLGLQPLGFIPGLLDMLIPAWDFANPDLFLLSFLVELKPDILRWDALLDKRPTIGILATDAHRNTLPFQLPDGDRADSYRRMMRWFANYVLVNDQKLDAIENAVRSGRMYGAFQVFGEPVGFDFHARTDSRVLEMGDTVSLAASPVLHVTAPHFFGMPPALDQPELHIRLIKAGDEGGTVVAESVNSDLELAVTQSGSYRAEIKVVPYHLKKWLGDDPTPFLKEYPLIYANAIYVTN